MLDTCAQALTAELTCAGMSYLPDGRLLTAGGFVTSVATPLPNQTYSFKPLSMTAPWSSYGYLVGNGRYYPQLVPLTATYGGATLCIGGIENNGFPPAPELRIELTTTNLALPTWSDVGSTTAPLGNYPRAYTLSNGSVLSASYITVGAATAYAPPGTTYFVAPSLSATPPTVAVSPGPSFPTNERRHFDSAVLMHERNPPFGGGKDRFIVFGGCDFDQFDAAGSPVTNANRSVFELDLAANQWVAKPDMNVGRAVANAVVLPTGEIGLFGGIWQWRKGIEFWPVGLSEIYDPGVTKTGGSSMWIAPQMPGVPRVNTSSPTPPTTAGNFSFTPRTHHSMALLLPDGRVLVASGEDMGQSITPTVFPIGITIGNDEITAASERTGEVYSPPYMFHGPRPRISNAPDAALFTDPDAAGGTIRVDVKCTFDQSIDSVVLISPTAISHHFSSTQIYIELEHTTEPLVPDGDQATETGSLKIVTATLPKSNLGPPGYYMLFVVTIDGAGNRIPSKAKFIRLDAP